MAMPFALWVAPPVGATVVLVVVLVVGLVVVVAVVVVGAAIEIEAALSFQWARTLQPDRNTPTFTTYGPSAAARGTLQVVEKVRFRALRVWFFHAWS